MELLVIVSMYMGWGLMFSQFTKLWKTSRESHNIPELPWLKVQADIFKIIGQCWWEIPLNQLPHTTQNTQRCCTAKWRSAVRKAQALEYEKKSKFKPMIISYCTLECVDADVVECCVQGQVTSLLFSLPCQEALHTHFTSAFWEAAAITSAICSLVAFLFRCFRWAKITENTSPLIRQAPPSIFTTYSDIIEYSTFVVCFYLSFSVLTWPTKQPQNIWVTML